VTCRVLCAYDDTAGAKKAFEYSLELASHFACELHVLAVIEPTEASRGVKPQAVLQQECDRFDCAFQNLRAVALSVGVPLQSALCVGTPAQQIVKRAEDLGADHLVVGQFGKNTLGGSLDLGSLRLPSRGTCAVTVVW
jgi:nucleotide-binding universal stress UspA family protein